MYMSGVGASPESDVLRELQGVRVLITGLSASSGVDVARTFADLKARLVLQSTELSPEVTEVVALLSQSAGELKLYTHDIARSDQAVNFARAAAQSFGGLDAVINLSAISAADMDKVAADGDSEALVNAKLAPMAHLTRVTANRMRLVHSEGLILNVLATPPARSGRDTAIASLARATLAAMTAEEARTWSTHGIRINAIGPRVMNTGRTPSGAYLTSEPDLAALAMYLASRRGRSLSGHVFDAEGAAALSC
ncbi:MAG: SDR family NAD(P)-dependent oxidoreductase [Hyphomicrobium sp.]